MTKLVWTREQDGEHNGTPRYEYYATSGDRVYHIVWASDRGGMFGYTARDKDDYIHGNYTITWARTLRNCKAACEEIEGKHNG
jgi:hypothetical protein